MEKRDSVLSRKWIHLHAHGVQEWKKKKVLLVRAKIKYIYDTKSYSALTP